MDRLLRLMAEKGTALNSTFLVFASNRGDSLSAVRTPWMYAVTKRASDLGVRIVAGTDGLFNARADSMPGLHRELDMLVNGAGLSPLEALRSATTNGAWAIGSTETGALAPGKLADIVLLASDPLADIRNTRSVRVVLQGGRVVRR
jgi:imidazolonepropionase-like amidohydrolase